MEKDILIIAHFCSDFDGKGNNRFNYLAEIFGNNYSSVELVTLIFHITRKWKEKGNIGNLNYKVTFIEEPIYKKCIFKEIL